MSAEQHNIVTPIGLTLLVEFPHHPEWETQHIDITLGEPFYLVGSEGKYTLFLQVRDAQTPRKWPPFKVYKAYWFCHYCQGKHEHRGPGNTQKRLHRRKRYA
jgi:hypothetical protein